MPDPDACDHNCIPCRGGLRHLFREGWVCVRCQQWSPTILPRRDRARPDPEDTSPFRRPAIMTGYPLSADEQEAVERVARRAPRPGGNPE